MNSFGRDRDLTIKEIKEFSDALAEHKANKLTESEMKRNMLNLAMLRKVFTEDQYRQIKDEIDYDDKNNKIFHEHWDDITESHSIANRDAAQLAANTVAEQLIKEEEEEKSKKLGAYKKPGTPKKLGGKSRNKNKTKTKCARKTRRRAR